jgi:plastocyanin
MRVVPRGISCSSVAPHAAQLLAAIVALLHDDASVSVNRSCMCWWTLFTRQSSDVLRACNHKRIAGEIANPATAIATLACEGLRRRSNMTQTHTIEITAMKFPADTPVAQGDTVVWTNRMSANHTITADDGSFDSGPLGKDKSFSHTFGAAGTVPYHCEIHPFMTGAVSVTASAAKTHTIEITAMKFPEDTPVAKGDTVVWINRMTMNHTVTSDDGSFDSGALDKDQSFSHVFAAAGTVPYRCKIHPGAMKGKVTVT